MQITERWNRRIKVITEELADRLEIARREKELQYV
jgi:hypothetical protein